MRLFNIALVVLTISSVQKTSVYGAPAALASTFSAISSQEKHPLEAHKSWDLHLGRTFTKTNPMESKVENMERKLSGLDDVMAQDQDDVPYEIVRKKPKKHIPFAGGDTMHGKEGILTK